jgi:hypothetical protein
MKFYNGALREARTVTERVSTLLISKIEIGEPLYAVDEDNVARLTEAYRRGEMLPPIRVQLLTDPARPVADARFSRIYGYSRILAATAAEKTEIDTEIVICTDAEALRMEALENLDRRSLNADQRMHGIAAILQSRLDEEQSVPLGPKGPAGHRGESGLSKAARDEGISETAAKRAMHIVAITPDAKALYRAELPNIARIDLEAIAAAPSERQVEVTQRIIDDRKVGRPRTTAMLKASGPPSVETPAAEDLSAKAPTKPSTGINVGAESDDLCDDPQVSHQGETDEVAGRVGQSPMGGAAQRDGTSETDPQAACDEMEAPTQAAGPAKGDGAVDPWHADLSKTERDFDRLQKSWERAEQAARQRFIAWLDGQNVLKPLMKRARAGKNGASHDEMAAQTDASRNVAQTGSPKVG